MEGKRSSYVIISYIVLIALSAVISPGEIYAAPACDRIFTLKQPSGYTFAARRRGNERYNWVETKDGYGIYKNKETRNWEYYVLANEADAEKSPKSTREKYLGKTQDTTSRAIVGKTNPASLGIPKGLRPVKMSEHKPRTSDSIRKNLLDNLLQSGTLQQGKTESPSSQELSNEAEHTRTASPLEAANSPESYTLVSPLSNSSSEITLQQDHEKNAFSNKVRGSKQVLVIGVDFKDCPATYSAGEIQSLVFGTSTGSVADYFKKVSYDEVTIEPARESYGTPTDGFVGWMRLNGNHPNTGRDTGKEENIQLAKDAIEAANEYINYADYDKDGDGVVSLTELAIIIVVAGYDAAYGEWKKPSVYAHSDYTYYYYDDSYHFLDYPRNTDDKEIEEYIQIGEKHYDHLATIGVICYELGKKVFSLPEFIDTYSINSGLGYFDSMAKGCWGAAEDKHKGSSPTYLSAWSREYLSWGTVTTITSSGTISFPKADGNKASVFRLDTSDPNQYFLIENRDFSGYDVGFQAQTGASGHGGLVVYHIDKSQTTWAGTSYSSAITEDENDKGVDVVEANEKKVGYCILDAPSSAVTDGSEITDIFFFSGNNASFTDTSMPSSRLKNGNSTLISITGISAHGDSMTATVTRPQTATTGSVTNLGQDSATLNGTVNAYGLTTTAWFEYGKASGSYTNTTSTKTISGTSEESVQFDIKNLSTGVFYYYRLAAKSSIGTVYGNEKKFIITKVPPAVAAGGYHNLALKSDGTVWAWGRNDYGQLGDGTTKQKNRAEEVYGLNGIVSIAAGEYHSLALRLDGTVWTWGDNSSGALCMRNDFETKIPAEVSGLNGVIAIAAGGTYNLALKSDGTVWEWSSPYGPYQVNLSDVVAIAAGNNYYFALALKSDGTVWAWGYNNDGQLGDGTRTYRYSSSPVKVSNITDVIAIAAGNAHSLALKSDGTVWTWGNNWYGQLGDFTYLEKLTPVRVSLSSGLTSSVTAIAAGGYHSLALLSDGTVWAWGNRRYGQLGNNTDGVDANGNDRKENTPVKVSDIGNITQIAAGLYHSLALKSDGTVFAWGYNGYEQLGDRSNKNKNYPVQVDNVNLGEKPSDKLGPIGSVSINSGAPYTDSVEVALTLSATDVYGVTGYCIHDTADTPSLSDPNWKTVSSSTLYSEDVDSILSRGDGTQTVYVCYKDTEGNRSSVASDSIILDTTNPTITITSPTSDSAYTTANSTISLSGEASDNGSGVSSVAWECSNGESDTADGTTSWSIAGITLSKGKNTITVMVEDGVGRIDTDSITVTYTPPMPTTTPTPATTPTTPPEGNSSIYGYVYDTNNYALQGVAVTIESNDSSDSAETNEDGYYEFSSLSGGDYTLTFEKEGYQTQTKDISLEEDEELEIETIYLHEMVKERIYGYVVDIYDDPIESANLKLKGFHTGTVKKETSDENGFFEFTDLEADTYIITAEKSRYRNDKKTVKLKEGTEEEIEIQLRRTSS